jgi:glycosyltransferase involved in cell wall biosynthesis
MGRIRFAGMLDNVQGRIARSDILVVPSLVEAAPYVILEAMAAARPVVASRIFGIPELVEEGETGILTAPGDAGALAEAILVLSADPQARKRMGEAGRRRYVNHFGIGRSIADTVAVYEELF